MCIVSLYGSPLFDFSSNSPFGGVEVQAPIFAKALAAFDDLDVSVLVSAEERPRLSRVGCIEIVSCPLLSRSARWVSRLRKYLTLAESVPNRW